MWCCFGPVRFFVILNMDCFSDNEVNTKWPFSILRSLYNICERDIHTFDHFISCFWRDFVVCLFSLTFKEFYISLHYFSGVLKDFDKWLDYWCVFILLNAQCPLDSLCTGGMYVQKCCLYLLLSCIFLLSNAHFSQLAMTSVKVKSSILELGSRNVAQVW